MSPRDFPGAWRRLRADRRGVAAVEFALVAPICMLLYCVGFEVSNAATVYRKLCDTTTQMASVTSQYTTMATSDISAVESASSQIMYPYSTTPLGIVISEVTTNSSGVATVTWSEPSGTASALATGSTVTTPSGFQAANTSYILVQTTYTYNPIIGGDFIGTINMTNQFFMLPRDSSSIPCSDC